MANVCDSATQAITPLLHLWLSNIQRVTLLSSGANRCDRPVRPPHPHSRRKDISNEPRANLHNQSGRLREPSRFRSNSDGHASSFPIFLSKHVLNRALAPRNDLQYITCSIPSCQMHILTDSWVMTVRLTAVAQCQTKQPWPAL